MTARPAGSRVSLCMIVRNEQSNLRACLEPVARLFDEIVVVDTGSTDQTPQIAREFGAQVYDFGWVDDFSAARNYSLNCATGDWAFWLDADDRVDRTNIARLAELFNGLGSRRVAFNMNCVLCPPNPADARELVTHTRLFRHDANIRWTRRIHEEIQSTIVAAGHTLEWTDIEILHLGYQDPALRQRKLQRDQYLLRLDYAIDPHDPITLFYLGQSHAAAGEHSQALYYLLRCHKHAQFAAPMARRMYVLLAGTLSLLGRKEEGLAICAEGLENFSDDGELLFLRATMLGELGDFGAAQRCLLRLIRKPKEAPYFLFGVDQHIERKAWFQLSLCYCDQRQFDEAEHILQELLSRHPDYAQAWVGLGQVYLATERWRDVEHAAAQLRKCPGGDVMADILLAESHSTRGAHDEARRLIGQAVSKAPRMIWGRIVLGEVLERCGAAIDECVAAWQEVLKISPGHAYAQAQVQSLLQLESPKQPAPPELWTSVTVAPGSGFVV